MILIVALAREEVDEAGLDAALQVAGHVVVHPFQAERHTDGFGWTILRAVVALHSGIQQVDAGHHRIVARDVRTQNTAQAMLPDRTRLAVADGIAFRHFLKKLFSRFRGVCFHRFFDDYHIISFANLSSISDFYKSSKRFLQNTIHLYILSLICCVLNGNRLYRGLGVLYSYTSST